MKTLQITGTSLWVTLGAFRRLPGDPKGLVASAGAAAEPAEVQLLDADAVAGWSHLYLAAVNAAKRTGKRSRSLAVETLLKVSCQSQINKALRANGLREETRGAAAVTFADSREKAEAAYSRVAALFDGEDDRLLELSPEKAAKLRRLHNVTDRELEAAGGSDALTRILIERGALLGLSG